MKNKLDLIEFIKSGKLTSYLYWAAILIIVAPIVIVFITDVPFSDIFTKIVISIAYIFILIGKIVTVINKKIGNEDIKLDIGILVGILFAMVFFIF